MSVKENLPKYAWILCTGHNLSLAEVCALRVWCLVFSFALDEVGMNYVVSHLTFDTWKGGGCVLSPSLTNIESIAS